MVFDWDDHCEETSAFPSLAGLKEIRSDFKCTLFSIPAKGSLRFWNKHPDWIELAMHGWEHPDPMECANWTRERMSAAMQSKPERFVHGWKSPGWQTSDEMFVELADCNWWIADQSYNDFRRPVGLRTHLLGGPDHWHGHTHDVCGNGLEETWDEVVALVKAAPSFEFMSEVVQPWVPDPVAA